MSSILLPPCLAVAGCLIVNAIKFIITKRLDKRQFVAQLMLSLYIGLLIAALITYGLQITTGAGGAVGNKRAQIAESCAVQNNLCATFITQHTGFGKFSRKRGDYDAVCIVDKKLIPENKKHNLHNYYCGIYRRD